MRELAAEEVSGSLTVRPDKEFELSLKRKRSL